MGPRDPFLAHGRVQEKALGDILKKEEAILEKTEVTHDKIHIPIPIEVPFGHGSGIGANRIQGEANVPFIFEMPLSVVDVIKELVAFTGLPKGGAKNDVEIPILVEVIDQDRKACHVLISREISLGHVGELAKTIVEEELMILQDSISTKNNILVSISIKITKTNGPSSIGT